MKFIPFCLALASLFCLSNNGFGEEESQSGTEPEEPPPPPVTQVYFSVYVWPIVGILTEESTISELPRLFYDSPDGIKRIKLSRNVATPLMPYKGTLPLTFFDVERIESPPPPDAPPETPARVSYRKIPKMDVSFPESWKQVLLIMMPAGPNQGGGHRMLAMRYDVSRVRAGYIRIYNTTEENLIVVAQDEQYALPALAPLDFQPKNSEGHQVFRLNIFGKDQQNDTVRLRLTTRISSREATSNFYLLYPSTPRRLRLMRVGGHEPPPTPTPVPPEPEDTRN